MAKRVQQPKRIDQAAKYAKSNRLALAYLLQKKRKRRIEEA